YPTLAPPVSVRQHGQPMAPAQIKRRAFLTLLAATAAWPLAARAQQMPVIGYLNGASSAQFTHLLAAFRKGLGEAGYAEGRNVAIEYRYADGRYDRLPALAPARAALVADPKSPVYDYFLRSANAAAPSLAIEVVPAPVENAANIERFFGSFTGASDGGLLLPPDVPTITHRDRIVPLAAKHRLPAVYSFRLFVVAGGLMSYGTDQIEMFGQTASYIDRILRGAKPADLPVQAPTRYETVLNLKTAKALGLTVPPGLLVPAH